ncbi:DUF1697 domain-containing protein [Paenibacillus sp. CN-4]|uniref:DUF1697 domain-containing protein n=1 Tax=Paenibacillus nanchangensis TaxID=3348343 RepID=UPI00397A5B8D
MIYAALLRGINVGGNNKIDMKQLKLTFEQSGMTAVKTYINSGNIIFADTGRSRLEIAAVLEQAILADYGLDIRVLVRSIVDMAAINAAIPADWTNDSRMKSDCLFLWDEIDHPSILERMTMKPEVDTVFYVPGAVLFSVPKDKVTRSGMLKLAGTALYKQMTVRNVNTARKIFELMQAAEVQEPAGGTAGSGSAEISS